MTLASLLALQDHDIATEQARHRRATLPEAARVREMTQARDALVSRRAEVATAQAGLEARQAAIEADVTVSRTKQAELAKRLAATSVPREAQTFQHELDTAHQRQVELEDAELELMEQLEPLETEAASLDDRLDTLAADLIVAQAELEVRQAEVEAEVAGLAAGRQPLTDAIDPDALATYERKRSKLGGVAVARLLNGTCMGCNIHLSSAELQDIAHLPPEEPAECESCGRMLIRT